MKFSWKTCLLILFCLTSASRAGAQAGDTNVGYRSVVELERSIFRDSRWLEEADLLMADLKAMDVQLHMHLNRMSDPEIRNRLIRERNNVRRLMIELTEARNSVFFRLEENKTVYSRFELGPGAGFPAR